MIIRDGLEFTDETDYQNYITESQEYDESCIRAEMGDHAFNIRCEEHQVSEAEKEVIHISPREFFRNVPGYDDEGLFNPIKA